MGSALLRSLISSLLAISVGCTASLRVGDNPPPDLAMSAGGADGGVPSSGKMPDAGPPQDGDVGFVSPPPDELILEVAGKTFRLCTPKEWSEMGGDTSMDCRGGAPGWAQGVTFDTATCDSSSDPPPPPQRYSLAVMFRSFDKAGVPPETSFDLADPLHQRFVTVTLWVEPTTIYCTDIPGIVADMGGNNLGIAGTIVVHKFVPRPIPGTSFVIDYTADVELANVRFAPLAGQDVYTVVHGHIYYL